MKRAEQLSQMEKLRKTCDVLGEEKRDYSDRTQMEKLRKTYDELGEEKMEYSDRTQKKKPKRKRNYFPLSYVEVISRAILSSPRKRLTLAEIYSFIQNNYPGFTENRVSWKNTVRYNLSLHECFQRGEFAVDSARCYWHIQPSFLAEFSRGDFSRRKLTQNPSLGLEGTSNLLGNQFSIPNPVFPWCICESAQPILPCRIGLMQYHQRGIPMPHGQHPYFPRNYWSFNLTQFKINQ